MKVVHVDAEGTRRCYLEDSRGDDEFLVSAGSGKNNYLFWTPLATLRALGAEDAPLDGRVLRAWLDGERGAPVTPPARAHVTWTSKRFGGAVYRVKAGAVGAWRCCVAYDDGTIERGVRYNRVAWDDANDGEAHAPWADAPNPKKRKADDDPAAAARRAARGDAVRPLLPRGRGGAAEDVAAFFAFVHERQEIWRKRATGGDPPWTDDGLLREYVFCNNYRELDRGTIYFRRCVEQRKRSRAAKRGAAEAPEAAFKDALWESLAYRLLNKIETFASAWRPGGGIPSPEPKSWNAFAAFLRDAHARGPIFSNAHQTMGLERYLATMGDVRARLGALGAEVFALRGDVEAVFKKLRTLNNVGPFLAWQVVCDLFESDALDAAATEDDWVMLGPGAKRGLARCFGKVHPIDELDLAKLLASVQRDAFRSLGLDFAFFAGKRLTLKNVEHCLCEFEKYRNNGAGMRRYASRAHLDADVVCAVCEDATDAKDADLLLCDLCNVPLHTFCLDPPLDRVPETAEWLCPACAGRWASSK